MTTPNPTPTAETLAETLVQLETKEVVFGGVCYFPAHPDADMHGLLRAVIRTRLFSYAIRSLSRYGVDIAPRDLGRTWCVSRSAVEHAATRGQHGEVLTVPLALCYLTPAYYRPAPRALMIPVKGRVSFKL